MKLNVIKNDGHSEDYMQTKILRTLCNCLSGICEENISTASELTDAFTFFVHNLENSNVITTGEIHSMLKAVLIETGFDAAAVRLHEHHYSRIIKRDLLEVVDMTVETFDDAMMFVEIKNLGHSESWNKSAIVNWLMQKYEIKYLDARAIAASVEEKVLMLNQGHISCDIIKQLVLIETAEFTNSQKMLNHIEQSQKKTDYYNTHFQHNRHITNEPVAV